MDGDGILMSHCEPVNQSRITNPCHGLCKLGVMLTLVDGVEFLSNRCIHGLQDFITPISFLGGTEAIMRGTDDGSWRILCALPVFQVQMLHPSGQAVVVKIVPLDWLCMCINQRKKRR